MNEDSAIRNIYINFCNEEYEKAKELSDQYLKHHPDDAKIVLTYGVCCFNQKDYITAERYINDSIKLDPRNTSAYENILLVYEKYILNSINDDDNLRIINEKYINTILTLLSLFDGHKNRHKSRHKSIKLLRKHIDFCYELNLYQNLFILIKNINRRLPVRESYKYWESLIEALFKLLPNESQVVYLKIFIKTITIVYNSEHSIHFNNDWILMSYDSLAKLHHMNSSNSTDKQILMYMFNELFQLVKFVTKFADCDLEVLLIYIKMEIDFFYGSFINFVISNRCVTEFNYLKSKLNNIFHTARIFEDVETGRPTFIILQTFFYIFNNDFTTAAEIFSKLTESNNDPQFTITKIFLMFFCPNYSATLFYIEKNPNVKLLNHYFDESCFQCITYMKLKCLLKLGRTSELQQSIDNLNHSKIKWIKFLICQTLLSKSESTHAQIIIKSFDHKSLSQFEITYIHLLELFTTNDDSILQNILDLLSKEIDYNSSCISFFKSEFHDVVSFLFNYNKTNSTRFFQILIQYCELNIYNGYYFYKIGNGFNYIYGDKVKMLECYEKAFHLGFQSVEILNYLLSYYCSNHKYEKAHENLNKAKDFLNDWIKDKDIVMKTSILLLNLGYYAKSSEFLEKYIKSDPSDSEVWYLLGLTYLRSQSYESSVFAFKRSNLIKNTFQCLNGLAKVYWVQMEYDKSISHFSDSLNLVDNHETKLKINIDIIELLIQSALSYWRIGNILRCKEGLKKSFIRSLTLLQDNVDHHVVMEIFLYSSYYCSRSDINLSIKPEYLQILSTYDINKEQEILFPSDFAKIAYIGYVKLSQMFHTSEIHKSALISYLNFLLHSSSLNDSVSDRLNEILIHFILSLKSEESADSSIFNILGASLLTLQTENEIKDFDLTKKYYFSIETIISIFTIASDCNKEYSSFSNLAIVNFLLKNIHNANYKLEEAIAISPEIPVLWHLKALFNDVSRIEDSLKYCCYGLSFSFNNSLAIYSIGLFYQLILKNIHNFKFILFEAEIPIIIQKYTATIINNIHYCLLNASGNDKKHLLYIYHILHYIQLSPFCQHYCDQFICYDGLNIYDYSLAELNRIDFKDATKICSTLSQYTVTPEYHKYLLTGLFYYECLDFETSLEHFMKSLNLLESDDLFIKSQIHLCISLCYYHLCKNMECIDSIKKSMQLVSTDKHPLFLLCFLSFKFNKIQNIVLKTFENTIPSLDEKYSLFEIYYYVHINRSDSSKMNTLIRNKILSHLHKYSTSKYILLLIQFYTYFTKDVTFLNFCFTSKFEITNAIYYGLYIHNKYLLNISILSQDQNFGIFVSHLKKYCHLFKSNKIFIFLLTKLIMFYSQLSVHFPIETLLPELKIKQLNTNNNLSSLYHLYSALFSQSSTQISCETTNYLLKVDQIHLYPLSLYILFGMKIKFTENAIFGAYKNYVIDVITNEKDISENDLLYLIWFERILSIDEYFHIKIALCDYFIKHFNIRGSLNHMEYFILYKLLLYSSYHLDDYEFLNMYETIKMSIKNDCNKKALNVIRFLYLHSIKHSSPNKKLDVICNDTIHEISAQFKSFPCWCNKPLSEIINKTLDPSA